MSVLSETFSRASWGARYRAGFGDRSANYPLPYCWTHHSVTAHLSPNASVAEEKAQMRILENIGQQRFGGGISYSFVIFPSGRIYMGTGASRRGAHTGGFNTLGIGVVFAGNYENHRPTAAAERTYAGLLQELAAIGVLQRARTNGGHRDAPGHSWNACPGRHLHSRLSAINSLAAGSSVTVTPPSEGEANMSIFDRSLDYVNEKATSARHQIARTHQYAHDIRSRIRSNSWADWVAGRFWGARLKTVNSAKNHWPTISERGFLASTWLQYVYIWARRSQGAAIESRNEAREVKAMVKAQAQALDELLQGQGAILKAVEEAETQVIQANAAEVAAELEITVRDQEDEDE